MSSTNYQASQFVGRSRAGSGGEDSQSDRLVGFLTVGVLTLSVSFFSVVTTISYLDRDFFERMLIDDINTVKIDPIMVGSTAKAPETIAVEPMPAPRIVRGRELAPADYSIVMVFGDEAHLASPGELWRVKEGMILPGLGRILSVEEDANGGTIKTEHAVLTGMPR
ncbi:hypothetical protein U0C82_09480 [Fulvimarina sp. 2208YS6-2-32]|uniref:Type II secretion system protein GspC N-terminal domain-containing protein n=1 Tax=Fulvimarina uroteuthidis TaxID=3098149 RepID=A0ABU5I219_9HYPH|nr:hypothetical protein [Fulvimarina sp. 2208YS6-2-32]MDY8109370.1 hypothetical protein [Fulvimarina sp. 2208YS6-2-32]